MGLRTYNTVSNLFERNILRQQPFKLHANSVHFTGLLSPFVHHRLGIPSCPPRGEYLHSTSAGNTIYILWYMHIYDHAFVAIKFPYLYCSDYQNKL